MSWKSDSNQSEIGLFDLLAFVARSWPTAVIFSVIVGAHSFWSFVQNPSFTASGTILLENSYNNTTHAIADKFSGIQGMYYDEEKILDKYLMLFSSQDFLEGVANNLAKTGKDKELIRLAGESGGFSKEGVAAVISRIVDFHKSVKSTIRVSVSLPNPDNAVAALNIIQEACVATIIERESLDLLGAREFLETKILEVEDRLNKLDERIIGLNSRRALLLSSVISGNDARDGALDKLEFELVQLKMALNETEMMMRDAEKSSRAEKENENPADKYSSLNSYVSLKRKAKMLRVKIDSTNQFLKDVIDKRQEFPKDDKDRADLYKKKELEYQFFADLKREIMTLDIQKISAQNRVRIIERAAPGSARSSRNLLTMVLKRSVFASILALAIHFLWELRNPVVRGRRDISWLKISFLGSVPDFNKGMAVGFFKGLLRPRYQRSRLRKDFMHSLQIEPDTFHDMIFKNLRTRIINFSGDAGKSPKVISVMSGSSGEGKTSVCSNLSRSFAMSGSKTLLIDADLRRRSLSVALNLQREKGISEYLSNPTNEFPAPLVKKIAKNLDALAAGQYSPHSTELVSGRHFREMLEAMRHYYEYIFIDTPPALPYSEVVPVAAASDLVIISILAGSTKIEAVDQMVDKLQFGVKTPIGYVLNKQEDRHMDAYYPYYQQSQKNRSAA